MVFSPGIFGLIISSFIVSLMLIYSFFFSIEIIRRWDLKSSAEAQLILERKTYLISTLISYVFAVELLSLFLFIHTADDLHSLFAGAMCAAGVLNVNEYGYPTLLLKIISFILASLWLIINALDNRGHDYPLIKHKYFLLAVIAPLIVIESFLQSLFFLSMKADVITSCCSSIFNTQSNTEFLNLSSIQSLSMMKLFYPMSAIILTVSAIAYFKQKGYLIVGVLALAYFLVSILSIISFISVYYYELPHHKCPFCILQKEYLYIGYFLYISLITGVVSALACGIISLIAKNKSIEFYAKTFNKRLVWLSIISFFTFIVLSSYPIVFSEFKLID